MNKALARAAGFLRHRFLTSAQGSADTAATLRQRVERLEAELDEASRLIGELRAACERESEARLSAEAMASLAISDRLLAIRMNEELLREVQRLSRLLDEQASQRPSGRSHAPAPGER